MDGGGVLPAADPGQPGRGRRRPRRARAAGADGAAALPFRPRHVRPGGRAGTGAVAGLPGHSRLPDDGRRRHRLAACQAGACAAAARVFHLRRTLAQGPGQRPRAAVAEGAALVQRTAAAVAGGGGVPGAGQAVLRPAYCMNQPWLTTMLWPVKALVSNAASVSATLATSSTVVNSPSTVSLSITFFTTSSSLMPSSFDCSGICLSTSGVRTKPGQITLARMPASPPSFATVRHRPSRPCLAVTYGALSFEARCECTEPM